MRDLIVAGVWFESIIGLLALSDHLGGVPWMMCASGFLLVAFWIIGGIYVYRDIRNNT